MRLRSSLSVLLLTATAVAGTALPASAAPAGRSLLPLAASSAERVRIADKVAAAKFGTTQPIDDPAREQVVLADVAAKSPALGLDPAETVRFFRDQIEANKVVQRGLYALWTAHPEQAPTERPDLPTEVRPVIDRITGELLAELSATRQSRAGRTCAPRLVVADRLTALQQRLDTLHRRALTQSLHSTCTPDGK
ncbi:chorismate mutase [Amycolatopsis nigrescens]|uniref:chorismate mutase n=1 Tax=Amycolatopsis nigrescens TaxID=381445 RepID=UPI00037AA92C|nr:chorismate mutase [Amycolatopsis nigrescens]